MVDRERVLFILRQRFPCAAAGDVAAAANAIVGLEDEWHEVECADCGALAEALASGGELLVLVRLPTPE